MTDAQVGDYVLFGKKEPVKVLKIRKFAGQKLYTVERKYKSKGKEKTLKTVILDNRALQKL